jgi:hypothetical protein
LGVLLFSGILERQIFSGKPNSVPLSTLQTIFLVPLQGVGGRKESKKEREIKSTRVKLAQKAKFKTRDESTPPVLAARGLFPANRGPREQGVPTGQNLIPVS